MNLPGKGLAGRVLAALTVAVSVGTLTAAPAQAHEVCRAISTPSDTSTYIYLCVEDNWEPTEPGAPAFQLGSAVQFGINSTSATGCKVTMWAQLDRPDTNVWQTKKVTRDCTNALASQNRGSYHGYHHLVSGTSATLINTRACIDLYYNGSSSSGWQRCTASGWHARPF